MQNSKKTVMQVNNKQNLKILINNFQNDKILNNMTFTHNGGKW